MKTYNFALACTEHAAKLYMDEGVISREDKEIHTSLLWQMNEAELNAKGEFTNTQHGSNDWF